MSDRLCSYTSSVRARWRVNVYDHVEYFLGCQFQECSYCSALMATGANEPERAVLGVCHRCGYWRIIDLRGAGGFHRGRTVPAITGVAKEFSLAAAQAPLEDLRRYLRSHPVAIKDVHPSDFEKLIRDCLRSVYPNCEVRHVGSTADGGIDIKIVENDADPILVQVKRRADLETNEGVDVVRSLNGVLFREGTARGMVVTSARGFTRGARMEANATARAQTKYRMELHGFADIVRWLKLPAPRPYEPWRSVEPDWTFERPTYAVDDRMGYFTF